MISKKIIKDILLEYDLKKIRIGSICSHSALQIFYGAKQEGFSTVGICLKNRKNIYEGFSLARPDEFLFVDNYRDVMKSKFQEHLRQHNTIIIPHGSFVEYVGPKKIENEFFVPIFGNRATLEWERDRKRQRQWLENAKLKLPKEYTMNSQSNERLFVKFSGARGGRGFFIASSKKELNKKLNYRIRKGLITQEEANNLTIQEFIPGVRYYPHYFYSLFRKDGTKAGNGRVELLSIDKRIEPIDESYRGLPDIPNEFFDYTVTGNQPVVVRESLLPDLINMGKNVINSSINLFSPGIIGAFCLETIFHPDVGFTVFEVSARIVAGTNLFPRGSPYSWYLFDKPMSTGRRIALEIREGIEEKQLEKIIF